MYYNSTSKIVLTGLAIAFGILFNNYSQQVFIEASSAAAQLGMLLKPLSVRDQGLFNQSIQKASSCGMHKSFSIDEAFARIQEGLAMAYKQREAELAHWIPKPSELSFNSLRNLIQNHSQ
jgi:hypothetical protein